MKLLESNQRLPLFHTIRLTTLLVSSWSVGSIAHVHIRHISNSLMEVLQLSLITWYADVDKQGGDLTVWIKWIASQLQQDCAVSSLYLSNLVSTWTEPLTQSKCVFLSIQWPKNIDCHGRPSLDGWTGTQGDAGQRWEGQSCVTKHWLLRDLGAQVAVRLSDSWVCLCYFCACDSACPFQHPVR